MKIVEITVSSGRVLPHPYVSYANLRPAVSLRATIEDGEPIEGAPARLRELCEAMLDDHVELIHRRLKVHHPIRDPDELDDEELDDLTDEEG